MFAINYSSSYYFKIPLLDCKNEKLRSYEKRNNILYVTLDHKTSLKYTSIHGYICSNSQKYIVWVKIIDFSFM